MLVCRDERVKALIIISANNYLNVCAFVEKIRLGISVNLLKCQVLFSLKNNIDPVSIKTARYRFIKNANWE